MRTCDECLYQAAFLLIDLKGGKQWWYCGPHAIELALGEEG